MHLYFFDFSVAVDTKSILKLCKKKKEIWNSDKTENKQTPWGAIRNAEMEDVTMK
jgi:hypothetical protein